MSAVPEQAALYFRPMQADDLDHVLEIENIAYEFPWTPVIFRDCLQVGYCSWLMESNGVIAGYGVMSVAAGEAHILNLCIDPQLQGAGYGHALLHFLLDVARQYYADTALLEVRPSNNKARLMYSHNGFVEVGARRDYYPAARGREDAIIMAVGLA